MANNTRSVLVVGLGRFGSSVATTLDAMGQDVLAVDKDGELVNRWSSQIPTVQADMTDVMALEQINASDFDTAVVAIGDSVEASVITAGNLLADVCTHFHLLFKLLAGVGMAEIDHHLRRQSGFFQPDFHFCHVFRAVVRLFTAAQDDVAVAVTAGVHDGRVTPFGH